MWVGLIGLIWDDKDVSVTLASSGRNIAVVGIDSEGICIDSPAGVQVVGVVLSYRRDIT